MELNFRATTRYSWKQPLTTFVHWLQDIWRWLLTRPLLILLRITLRSRWRRFLRAHQTFKLRLKQVQQLLAAIDRFWKFFSGAGYIWWSIKHLRKPWIQAIAIGLFMMMFMGFGFTPNRSVIMVASMWLHEMGHGLVFGFSQIEYVMMYFFPWGALAAPATPEMDKQSDELYWWRLAVLMLAGPAINVLLLVIGLLIARDATTPEAVQWGKDIFEVNQLLAVMNLIPLGKLDAGQFLNLIYSSLKESAEDLLAFVLVLFFGWLLISNLWGAGVQQFVDLLINLVNTFHLVALCLVLIACFSYMTYKDNPELATSPKRITLLQLPVLMACYFSLVYLAVQFQV